jgi:hypothetical protein
VIRRCPAPLTAVVASLALGFGLQPVLTHADQMGTADYTLTTTTALPAPSGPMPTPGSTNIPSPQVLALIEPAGGVVTPATTSTQGPLTILPGSSGFDTNGVYDYLANVTQNGQPFEGLGLSFYGQGLAANGVLNFSLNVTNVSNPPQLVSGTSGVTITLDPTSSSSGSSSSSSSSSTSGSSSSSSSSSSGVGSESVSAPEPLSILLWATLVAAGFVRARMTGRASRVVSHR